MSYTAGQRFAAWSVHVYTAMGLPLGLLALWAISERKLAVFFTAMWVATLIDATDGFLARKFDVKHVTPTFDGRRLDDIVDYLMFAFIPAVGLVGFDVLPGPWRWVALLPVLSSAYGFCQDNAKTEDSFVGFPSYWNIVVIYLIVLQARPIVATAFLAWLTVMVFVPIHYLYPSRARFLRKYTIGLGVPWAFALLVLCLRPTAPWAIPLAWVSLLYLVYYFFASLAHHRRITRLAAGGTA